jgi:hypothetical protein
MHQSKGRNPSRADSPPLRAVWVQTCAIPLTLSITRYAWMEHLTSFVHKIEKKNPPSRLFPCGTGVAKTETLGMSVEAASNELQ